MLGELWKVWGNGGLSYFWLFVFLTRDLCVVDYWRYWVHCENFVIDVRINNWWGYTLNLFRIRPQLPKYILKNEIWFFSWYQLLYWIYRIWLIKRLFWFISALINPTSNYSVNGPELNGLPSCRFLQVSQSIFYFRKLYKENHWYLATSVLFVDL